MKNLPRILARLLVLSAVVACLTTSTWAQDMRAASQKAARDCAAAEEADREATERILKDRTALLAEVTRLEALEKGLEQDVAGLSESIAGSKVKEAELSERWAAKELQFREIIGTVRISARELETIVKQSLFTAGSEDRLEKIKPLVEKKYFPGLDDIRLLAQLYLDETRRSGEVVLKEQTFVNRTGEDMKGQVLTLGKFTAVYDTGEETGFLRYSEDGRRFYALSELPGRLVRRNLKKYIRGETDAVYIDLSGGAALRQITHKPSLWEQIRSGGPIVWPILAIALLALVLILERVFYLNRVHGNTDRIMATMNRMAASGDWEGCEALVKKYEPRGWPVVNIMAAGLSSRNEDRETQENILQEAILREAPRLERFLAVLGILGAIAPLLGLLGTVTGMISTFRVITLYGTGDPKMMSGGISEALITTELGLAVAIPIMLFHTFLSRRVDHIIGEMEEKAVGLTNITQKERTGNGAAVQRG